MALEMRKAAGATAKAAGSLRETVQDLLVPELREIKADVVALRDELRLRTEHLAQQDANLREDIRSHVTSLRDEIRLRDVSLREELRLRDEKFSQAVKGLSDKLDTALDVRERLIALEARSPRVQ